MIKYRLECTTNDDFNRRREGASFVICKSDFISPEDAISYLNDETKHGEYPAHDPHRIVAYETHEVLPATQYLTWVEPSIGGYKLQ